MILDVLTCLRANLLHNLTHPSRNTRNLFSDSSFDIVFGAEDGAANLFIHASAKST